MQWCRCHERMSASLSKASCPFETHPLYKLMTTPKTNLHLLCQRCLGMRWYQRKSLCHCDWFAGNEALCKDQVSSISWQAHPRAGATLAVQSSLPSCLRSLHEGCLYLPVLPVPWHDLQFDRPRLHASTRNSFISMCTHDDIVPTISSVQLHCP